MTVLRDAQDKRKFKALFSRMSLLERESFARTAYGIQLDAIREVEEEEATQVRTDTQVKKKRGQDEKRKKQQAQSDADAQLGPEQIQQAIALRDAQ